MNTQSTTEKSTAVEAIPELVPKTWPGAFGIYKSSRRAVLINLVPIIELWFINVIASFILNYIKLIGPLISLLLGVFIATCIYQLYLAGVNGKTMELGKSIDITTKLYVRMIGIFILIGLTSLSFLLLIIPGLIIVPRVILAPYFLIDKNLGVMDAYKASWNETKGHVGKIYGIFGVTILMILPSITIIGVLLTIYWVVLYGAAMAILYKYISKKAN